jgi:hypothetical protein
MQQQQNKHTTHAAALYHVLSVLHRLGAKAKLNRRNKNAVHVVVMRDNDEVTLDVKGLAGKTCWPVDNVKEGEDDFYVLVCFNNKMDDLSAIPEIYVLPCERLDEFTYIAPTSRRRTVEVSHMRRPEAGDFKDAWHLILGPETG